MFELITPIDRVFRQSAVCYDSTVKAALQIGGFVTLSYPYSSTDSFVNPTASLATDDQILVYPVFIERPGNDPDRPDFLPIDGTDLVTFWAGPSGYEGFVNTDSFDEGSASIAATNFLKIKTVSSRPKLIVSSGDFTKDVAIAVTPNINGKVRVRWIV